MSTLREQLTAGKKRLIKDKKAAAASAELLQAAQVCAGSDG